MICLVRVVTRQTLNRRTASVRADLDLIFHVGRGRELSVNNALDGVWHCCRCKDRPGNKKKKKKNTLQLHVQTTIK